MKLTLSGVLTIIMCKPRFLPERLLYGAAGDTGADISQTEKRYDKFKFLVGDVVSVTDH